VVQFLKRDHGLLRWGWRRSGSLTYELSETLQSDKGWDKNKDSLALFRNW